MSVNGGWVGVGGVDYETKLLNQDYIYSLLNKKKGI